MFAQGESSQDLMLKQSVANFLGGFGAFEHKLVKGVGIKSNLKSTHFG